mmetsp:Transcript_6130/g.24710  ORF Transcript_6130/g.24710 Transcript_6130/m.24710 type:complete len:232 (+) Transcript_6130:3447-4142(+)
MYPLQTAWILAAARRCSALTTFLFLNRERTPPFFFGVPLSISSNTAAMFEPSLLAGLPAPSGTAAGSGEDGTSAGAATSSSSSSTSGASISAASLGSEEGIGASLGEPAGDASSLGSSFFLLLNLRSSFFAFFISFVWSLLEVRAGLANSLKPDLLPFFLPDLPPSASATEASPNRPPPFFSHRNAPPLPSFFGGANGSSDSLSYVVEPLLLRARDANPAEKPDPSSGSLS